MRFQASPKISRRMLWAKNGLNLYWNTERTIWITLERDLWSNRAKLTIGVVLLSARRTAPWWLSPRITTSISFTRFNLRRRLRPTRSWNSSSFSGIAQSSGSIDCKITYINFTSSEGSLFTVKAKNQNMSIWSLMESFYWQRTLRRRLSMKYS